jgi:hypothetical protein
MASNVRNRNTRVYLSNYMARLEENIKSEILRPRTRNYASGSITSPVETTGNLRNSIYVYESDDSDSIRFELYMDEYGEQLNSGSFSGEVDVDDILNWARAKKISPKNAKGRFMKLKKFAHAATKSINNIGVKPAEFIDDALKRSKIDARTGRFITNAFKADLEEQIEDMLNDAGYKQLGTTAEFYLPKQ